MLYNVLISYLNILSKPRYESCKIVPDGSDILDCITFGFSKLVEKLEVGDDLVANNEVMHLLHELNARLGQVAYSSKHWNSEDEWALVYLFTWKVIEALRLDDNGEVESSVEDM
jgi:hypothetical protein